MKIDEASTFTCWKEIAAYMGKGVRTVQRWERQFGLPVQRPYARCKGIVRASREELDHWVNTQWSRRSSLDRKPEVEPHRDRSEVKYAFASEELKASNHKLLEGFKESLRELNTHCEELRQTVNQGNQHEKPESSAA